MRNRGQKPPTLVPETLRAARGLWPSSANAGRGESSAPAALGNPGTPEIRCTPLGKSPMGARGFCTSPRNPGRRPRSFARPTGKPEGARESPGPHEEIPNGCAGSAAPTREIADGGQSFRRRHRNTLASAKDLPHPLRKPERVCKAPWPRGESPKDARGSLHAFQEMLGRARAWPGATLQIQNGPGTE
jgi:hypothetical protein